MRAMTEIEWLDGRVTKVPELALGDALGESVQAELDFGFDDVLEGLWVEVRHHEPDEDSDGDPRGRGCALYADCRYSLVEPSDLDRVFCILVMRLRRARDDGRLDREAAIIGKARLLVIDELGFLPLDADGARLLFQVLADAYERQSVVFTTNLEFSRCGRCSGTTRWPPP